MWASYIVVIERSDHGPWKLQAVFDQAHKSGNVCWLQHQRRVRSLLLQAKWLCIDVCVVTHSTRQGTSVSFRLTLKNTLMFYNAKRVAEPLLNKTNVKLCYMATSLNSYENKNISPANCYAEQAVYNTSSNRWHNIYGSRIPNDNYSLWLFSWIPLCCNWLERWGQATQGCIGLHTFPVCQPHTISCNTQIYLMHFA